MKTYELVIVGAGPAGLSAAIEAARLGVDVLLIDENARPGGQLFKQIHKFFGSKAHQAGVRGYEIGTQLLETADELNITTWLDSEVIGIEADQRLWVNKGKQELLHVKYEALILASGAVENAASFENWDLPGVMGAGAAQTMINVQNVLPGKRVLMLGSGNVGVIVAYQLLQAGAEVVAIVEGAPRLGGYGVHTAKVRRRGVPFYTSHTVKRAFGDKRVEGVEICEVDTSFKPIEGTEKYFDVDTICLATGLSPLTELAWLIKCKFIFVPTLGGHIPLHNEKMQTSIPSVFVAGDIAGVEEASTAMDEGRLAGLGAALLTGHLDAQEYEQKASELRAKLDALREGYFGQKRKDAKNYILSEAAKEA